jgi:type II secretory pathway pseudopilin PulG
VNDAARKSTNRGYGKRRRRGLAVIIVLAILSITLALSYSVMRTQVTAVQIQNNAGRRAEARQAAQAGVSAAMRRMHQADWSGADSSFSGSLGANSGYSVTFSTGDSSLVEGDPDYDQWPYRVTISSTGYAADPADANLRAEHTVRVVMQLVRRQRAAQPGGWLIPQAYTVYQWKPDADYSVNNRFVLEYPARISGRVRLQGRLDLCVDYPEHSLSRERLLSDLNLKRTLGLGDKRPLTGRVDLPYAYTSAATLSLLTVNSAATTLDAAQSTACDFNLATGATTYRLYEGGREYTAVDVGSVLQNVTLEADPETNPLGIFYHVGRVDIHNNVTIRGTLIVVGESAASLYIDGTNVLLEGGNLPALEGASQPVQLPAVISHDDLRILAGASVVINGMAIVDDEFEVAQANQSSIDFRLNGRMICGELIVHGRNEWDQSATWYQTRHTEFLLLELVYLYYPNYLETFGLNPTPKIVLQGPTTATSYHWPSSDADPLLVPHANDDALVWELVEWRDGA